MILEAVRVGNRKIEKKIFILSIRKSFQKFLDLPVF